IVDGADRVHVWIDGVDGPGHCSVVVHLRGELDVVGHEGRAVVPERAVADHPGRLHRAVGQEGPESVFETRQLLREQRDPLARGALDGEPRAGQPAQLLSAVDATAAASVERVAHRHRVPVDRGYQAFRPDDLRILASAAVGPRRRRTAVYGESAERHPDEPIRRSCAHRSTPSSSSPASVPPPAEAGKRWQCNHAAQSFVDDVTAGRYPLAVALTEGVGPRGTPRPAESPGRGGASMVNRYVDADGHVMENMEEISDFLEGPYRDGRGAVLPSLDRFHTPTVSRGPRQPGTFDRSINAARWVEFLDKASLDATVLYPTTGLAFGQIVYPDWAVAYARAYNDWLSDRYLQFNPRLKGAALIPMQDVPSAIQELRRAVTELGMVAAMIPSNGLTPHVSHKDYWPIYEEAQKLGCALAVHGGCYGDLGFDTYRVFPATRALGMPFPLAIAMTGFIVDGVLDAFPDLRIGFLEGGTAWIPLVIDRLERERLYS